MLANQSLERTPDKQGCVASPVVWGRRSAHRSAPWKTKDGVFQMHEIDRRDSSILAAQFRSLLAICVGAKARHTNSKKCLRRLSAGAWGTSATTVRRVSHGEMASRRSPAPVHAPEPNQSLERTPAEQDSFASPVVCRRRSALRSALAFL